MILLVDNYDSFTYNVYQFIGAINPNVKVVRNDKITLEEIGNMKPSHIIFSPGPGHPSNAGLMEKIIETYYSTIPMLGICLGHQAIGEVFGGKITLAKEIMHGKSSKILVSDDKIFENIERQMLVGRYHSLIVEETGNESFKVLSKTDDGEIMAIKHNLYPVYGVQFHPESILTTDGIHIIKNFLSI